MTTDLRSLMRRERQLQHTIDGVQEFIRNYNAEHDERQVSVRLQMLEQVFTEFYTNRGKIELLLEKTTEPTAKETEEEMLQRLEDESCDVIQKFENRYCTLKGELLELQADRIASRKTADSIIQTGATFSKVKLPEIRLPTFTGKICDWISFRDTFRSLIHVNTQLTEMDKFTYLRSALSGEALQEINSVELSAVNYSVAWDALESRYENRKLIVKGYLDSLFALEGLRKESYEGLNHLVSEFEKNLHMLEKIGENTAQWSTILAYMVSSRLDLTTLRHWETHHNSKDVPTYHNLITFLQNHCSVLQSVAPPKPTKPDYRQPSVCHATVNPTNQCPFCHEPWHSPFQCSKFQRMKVVERSEAVNRCKLCRNCLRPGHFARNCEGGTCRHCRQRHHSMLHSEQTRFSGPQSLANPPTSHPQSLQSRSIPRNQNPNQTHAAHTVTSQNSNTQSTTQHATPSQSYVALPVMQTHDILLSTALVEVEDKFGNRMLARALLDSCSQHCLMTRSFSTKLNFEKAPVHLTIQGIGSSQSVSTKSVRAVVRPRSREISQYAEEIQFYVLPKLTVALPTTSFNTTKWDLPGAAYLADPQFNESSTIDLIIGAEYYMDLLRENRRKATVEGPTLQDSVFGWIVSGRISKGSYVGSHSLVHVCSNSEIHDQLAKFWELETCRSASTLSIEETACEKLFDKTTIRDASGRFVVTLPTRENVLSRLGESKRVATKRFMGLERRFENNPELKAVYTEFIHEYQALGHMKEVQGDSANRIDYYLPHHAVFKPDSTTTKLRVVFDGSCRTSTGISLNDALMVGPVVQDELIDIVLRFRLHRFALVADIAKMYRMVQIREDDQHLQRILWRDSTDQAIRTFELTTVTYGTASAPYLATKCLQRLAEIADHTHPVAAAVLKKGFYVDDLLYGVENANEGRILIAEIVQLLQSAGFSLRKWNSNCRELLADVPEELLDDRSVLQLDSSCCTVKTLGLVWETTTDSFRFSTPVWNSSVTINKRSVLSDVSRLFDPLGLVGPVIIQAKIFIQELWKQDYEWDEPLNPELQDQWHQYRLSLTSLDGIAVPRWVGLANNIVAVEFHGFCDASEKAYGACVYVRTVAEDGSVSARLLVSKSRVAPLENLKKGKKRQSIPRLELSAALLLSHLYDKIVHCTQINAMAYFWTDSTIVKYWISSTPSRWKQFVANRVSEIQHITQKGVWNHVAGEQNPADIISRGMNPAQLQYQQHWFNGPHWLLWEKANWPKTNEFKESDIEPLDLEEKSVTAVLPAFESSKIFDLRSSLTDLVRLAAWILRFRHNARTANRNNRRNGFLSVNELDEGLRLLTRLSQKECFNQEVYDLTRKRQVKTTSRIASLNPQLLDGIICVGGRLQNAAVSSSRKHPFVLDHRHPLTKAVVVHYHRSQFHVGQQQLVAAVRERFWPTSIRNLVRKVIHECVACFRAKPKTLEQLMADLPPERVTPCCTFRRVGIDYCGPFFVSYPQRRCRPVKCFVAIFICLVTKAVHLEVAADLSTQAFLAALKRFSSRRGKPDLIMCDNGTNFVGAKRELDELRRLFQNQQFQETMVKETALDRIQFRFIPARSPNFGGLWESAVKSFKTLFKRTIGTRNLVYDEMQTLLVQIEAILNSRPLTPISNDPDDFEALTPGHFLVQRPLTAIPEPDLGAIPDNRLSAWQRVQHFTQLLWKKWSSQYLSDLHNRTKWTRKRENIAVDTMVILKDDNLPPLKWQLARVTQIHPGEDGNVRVVTVRTKDGSYRRAISKVCILPIRDNMPVADGEN